MGERISGFKGKVEKVNHSDKENIKSKKNVQAKKKKIQDDSLERPNLRVTGLEEGKDTQVKDIFEKKNERRKFPQSKERDAYHVAKGIQNTK